MPEPRDLRMHEHGGRCVIMAGSTVLYDYAATDVVMRNMALCGLRQLGFRGRAVAAVLGLSEAYVATLHNAAKRDGSAALVMQDRRARRGRSPRSSGSRPGVAGAGRQRRGDRAAAERGAHDRQPRRWDRAGRPPRPAADPAGRRRNPCSPA